MQHNQPPPLEPYNLFSSDPTLYEAVVREGGAGALEELSAFGARVGAEEVFEWGHLANRHEPELITHDRFGERADEVRYHPAYHALMAMSVEAGIHCSHYAGKPGDGSYVARNARMFMMSQVDTGHCCPISMTGAVLPALSHTPELRALWEPRIASRHYDPRLLDPAEKRGCLLGMGLTERQGGSDVRVNSSVASPVDGGGPGGEYRLSGHKWFTSAPMCDAFLMLAQAPGGLSCFLVPRILPDGTRNPIALMRLKEKLGNRSNASSEIEYVDAAGWLVGEEGRGVRTIIDMVGATRIDCTNWAAAMMRQAVAQAAWHVSHRSAFGARLIDQPLMQNVVADLELETRAATLMVMRLSGAYERAPADPAEALLTRLGSAVAKYWITKRSTPVIREALECVGGNGYVEESIMPRLYREAPLNAIWEGAGNVIALDVLRALSREPACGEALLNEIARASGNHAVLDREIGKLREALARATGEHDARRLVELMATTWSASLLTQHAGPEFADAYIGSRLAGEWGTEFGTLTGAAATQSIARQAVPHI